MGEEWGCRQPFLFFCDFEGELGEAVRNGRREEFKRFAAFKDPKVREKIPDPLAESTFRASTLDWSKADESWRRHYRELLALRQKEVVPLDCGPGRYRMLGERAFEVDWGKLKLLANCGEQPVKVDPPQGRTFWSNGAPGAAWSVNWLAQK
jgi:maltooligosyltrehalose trehalohydrolase